MKPSPQVQASDGPEPEDWTIVELDRPLVDAILNTIRNLELEGQYVRLRSLFEQRRDLKP